MTQNFPIHLLGVSKLYRTTFSSDLRKPCGKTGKSLSSISNIGSVIEKIIYYITNSLLD